MAAFLRMKARYRTPEIGGGWIALGNFLTSCDLLQKKSVKPAGEFESPSRLGDRHQRPNIYVALSEYRKRTLEQFSLGKTGHCMGPPLRLVRQCIPSPGS